MRRASALGLVVWMAWAGWAPGAVSEPDRSRQRYFLDQLLRVLPREAAWERWLEVSGELPPDFAQMPSRPGLPDPLRFGDGRLATRETWLGRRQELLGVWQRLVLGTFPASPAAVRAADVRTREETAALIQEVRLQFGPQQAAQLHLEFLIPEGEGGYPVVILPESLRSWGLVGVSRGYLVCLYAAGETRDDSEAWRLIWPEHDWARVTRRAWAVSRCLDYLAEVPFADAQRVAVAGHGLSAQVALVAGAIDRRLAAVLASSPGPGVAFPFRFLSEAQLGQGIETITRLQPGWLHPRLRFFAGRESKLPVDGGDLLACLAPQPCLLAVASEDAQENLWALEQAVLAARTVYTLFDRTRALTIQHRPGGSETGAGVVESYFDWLDTVLDRGDFPVPDAGVYPSYDTWHFLSGLEVDLSRFPTNDHSGILKKADGLPITDPAAWWAAREALRERVVSTLGEGPPFASVGAATVGGEPPDQAMRLGRHHVPSDLAKRSVRFGNNLVADIYFSSAGLPPSGKRPTVIWLPPVDSVNGYMPGLPQVDPPVFALARAGFAVLAFDPIGTGSRVAEVTRFYHRYPEWSLLGKQVDDVLAAVDALVSLDFVEARQLYLLGYGSGSRVALHVAAFESRIAGLAALGGLKPLGGSSEAVANDDLARWSRWFPLHPHLGSFIGQEARLPYDYHELLALVAPRPALLFVPELDETSDLGGLQTCVRAAVPVYDLLGGAGALQIVPLSDPLRAEGASWRLVTERLATLARLRGAE